MKTTLSPYLTFDGNAAEAMQYYQSVLGGELTIQTFGESGMSDSDELKDRIIHASLVNKTLNIMASDSSPEHSPPVTVGNNVNLSINGSDEKMLTGYFQKLSEGGKITMPLEKQFWGDIFGSCEDKFGIHWMINIAQSEE